MARSMTQPEAKPWINAIHAYTPGKAKSDDGRVLIKLSENRVREAVGTGADVGMALNSSIANGALAIVLRIDDVDGEVGPTLDDPYVTVNLYPVAHPVHLHPGRAHRRAVDGL